MSYLDIYNRRLKSYGNSSSDAQLNATKNVINSSFKNNPSYSLIKVNEIDTDALVEQGEHFNDKELLFLPDTVFNVGDIVEISGDKYLIIDFHNHQIYPTALIQLCNTTFSFTGQPTQVDTGKVTDWGEPIYDNQPGQLYSYPCIVSSVRDLFAGDNSSNSINIVDSKIALIIQYDNNAELKENVEFDLFGNHYRIYGFDRSKILNDTGLLIVLADKH